MTIGEKIKFYRKQKGITQQQLAQISSIHPVSIRKYETNKMQPQITQIERIAKALGINTISLVGVGELKFDTIGNMMSVLLLLIKSDILMIGYNKDKRSKLSSVKLSINPVFSSFLSLCKMDDKSICNLNDLSFFIKNQKILTDLVCYCIKREQLNNDDLENFELSLQADFTPFGKN